MLLEMAGGRQQAKQGIVVSRSKMELSLLRGAHFGIRHGRLRCTVVVPRSRWWQTSSTGTLNSPKITNIRKFDDFLILDYKF